MAKKSSDLRRIMLAITESSSLSDLWSAVQEHLESEPVELITVFLSDDRWRRAASLSFTREIPRTGGGSRDFTPQRANQVGREAVTRAQTQLQQLASGASVKFGFEMLAEHELTRLHEIVTSESDLLIVPAFLQGKPLYAELTRLKCRVLVIDTEEMEAQP